MTDPAEELRRTTIQSRGETVPADERVESMLTTGRAVVDGAIREYEPCAILVGFSGGNDSVVVAHFATSQYDALPFHCDTGIGLAVARRHVDRCAERLGWSLRVEQARPCGPPKRWETPWIDGDTAYEEFVLNHGFPGPRQHHRMFQRLKERPLRRIQKEAKSGCGRNRTVLVLTGIRHDESLVRAGYKRNVHKEEKSSRVWVNPFYAHTKADFAAYRDEFGLPSNPVSPIVGVSGECCCGAYAHRGEFDAIASVEPEFAERLKALESRAQNECGFPWGWGESPPEWWSSLGRGQQFFDFDEREDSSMCARCINRRRP